METCPVCNTPMHDDSAIGRCCLNDDCPVEDDALLWYQNSKGEWMSQKWIRTVTGPNSAVFRLSEKEN